VAFWVYSSDALSVIAYRDDHHGAIAQALHLDPACLCGELD